MTAKHRRLPTIHRGRRALAGLAAAGLLTVGVAGAPAFAAKNGGGGKPTSGSAGTAGCTVNPNPVAVGSDYTISGSGLGAYTYVNVLISNAHQTTSWNLQSDATGHLSVTDHAYWSGGSTVTMQANARHGFTTLGTCAFTVT